MRVEERGGGLREQIPLLLVVLADQETSVSGVDRNQLAMLVASSVESLTGAASDVVLFVPDDCLERTNVASRDRTDDPALSVPNKFLF